MNLNRPYLIIPKLIEQPTWGGTYISELKGWQNLPALIGKKIGQSYELYSGTKLAINITDTNDPKFIPEVGNADNLEVDLVHFGLTEGVDYVNLESDNILLIKINQSKGNSFQLHVKHDAHDTNWKPKAESWYYFEPGKLTFGIKQGINVEDYKKTCLEIEAFMKNLSADVVNGTKNLEAARSEARLFASVKNPWQFVNVHEAKKYEIVDPSIGGIHHSWEEDSQKYPLGNIVYEIQEDVMDPVSTVRAFDQGKIKDDGTIRSLNIEDYFKYLDTSNVNNDIERSRVLSNSIYAMEVLNVDGSLNMRVDNLYHHLYVREGQVEIISGNVKLVAGRGHSVFVPKDLKYIIIPIEPNSVVLKTFSTKQ